MPDKSRTTFGAGYLTGLATAALIVVAIMAGKHQTPPSFGHQLRATNDGIAVADMADAVMGHSMKHKSIPASIKDLDEQYATVYHVSWPNVILQDGTGIEPPELAYTGSGFGIYQEHGDDGKLHLLYWPHEPRNRRGE